MSNRKLGSIALARKLCVQIAGYTDDDQDQCGHNYGSVDIAEILSAEVVRLQKALAQPVFDCPRCGHCCPEAKPVAWAVQACSKMWRGEFAEIEAKAEAKRIGGTCVAFALYTEPPQRSWVGLTPDEILDLFDVNNVYGSKWIEFARTVETKLNEKNK
jgi:hypothetical protein